VGRSILIYAFEKNIIIIIEKNSKYFNVEEMCLYHLFYLKTYLRKCVHAYKSAIYIYMCVDYNYKFDLTFDLFIYTQIHI